MSSSSLPNHTERTDNKTQSSRLDAPFGSQINRDKPLTFYFDGKPFAAYEGDTVASALAANGQFVLSRSFKYHRARGALTMAGQDANTIVQIPGNPNALADCVRVTEGLEVKPVNVHGSVMNDRGRFLGMFSRFLPVGFYYKAFYKPIGAWEYWSKLFRRMTGLGTLDTDFVPQRHDKRYRFFDVVVVGGGAAGIAAALEASKLCSRVLLVDENRTLGGAFSYLRSCDGAQFSEDSRQRLLKELEQTTSIEVMTEALCNGWFSDNWLAIIRGNTLHKVRTEKLILATGVLEQPAIFRNNDLPGVLLSSAVQRLLRQFAVKPGSRAVVLTSNDDGYATALDMVDAGVEIAAVIDRRIEAPDSELAQTLVKRGVLIETKSTLYAAKSNRAGTKIESVEIRKLDDKKRARGASLIVAADCICVAVGYMPTYQLACQAGASLSYDDSSASFSISDLPEFIQLAGSVNGYWQMDDAIIDGRRAARVVVQGSNAQIDDVTPKENSAIINARWPITSHPKGKEFVDFDEDLQINDLVHATLDGYQDIQLVKRYSTCGMGPSQGRQSALAAARIVADATAKTVAETGVTTARPPFAAESLAHSAGRSFFPKRLSSMHHCHIEAGAHMMQAGAWDRPAFYGEPSQKNTVIQSEVTAVRQGVGLIDVSTLGGLDIRGPDAAEFVNRMYTWGFAKQPVGRARYALMTDQAGVVIDDGVACRLSEEHYYVTATTSGVDRVYRLMLKWNAQWRLDVDVANVTGAWCAVNLAGPLSRQVLVKLCKDVALDAERFGYMEARQGAVADIPSRILRVGFVGELGYEIHVPQMYGERLWQALMSAGHDEQITPFGVEAQRVMRLEKGHIIIGQDTDAMSNPYEVQMKWAVSNKKPFFVGERSLKELKDRGIKRKLVGFMLDPDTKQLPLENQLILDGDAMIGRVTSCAYSPTLGYPIGLAYVPSNYSRDTMCIKVSGKRVSANLVETPFYDSDNSRQAL